jgi:hypothetical protein
MINSHHIATFEKLSFPKSFFRNVTFFLEQQVGFFNGWHNPKKYDLTIASNRTGPQPNAPLQGPIKGVTKEFITPKTEGQPATTPKSSSKKRVG